MKTRNEKFGLMETNIAFQFKDSDDPLKFIEEAMTHLVSYMKREVKPQDMEIIGVVWLQGF